MSSSFLDLDHPQQVFGDERVIVLDFGSQYSHLISRRCREIGVYAELFNPNSLTLEAISRFSPRGIILSGGPASVYENDSPHLNQSLWQDFERLKIPVLGICYGLQEMVYALGGKVSKGERKEFGSIQANLIDSFEGNPLFDGFSFVAPFSVWMSHGDEVVELPDGFVASAKSDNCNYCAIHNLDKNLFGLQFHPEVTHTEGGQKILENFLIKICLCNKLEWNMKKFATDQVERISAMIASNSLATVIGAVSGGVDSTVAACLVHKAIGNRFFPILVDSGLLRKGEAVEVKERLEKIIPGFRLTVVDASEIFYLSLATVTEPEEKRRIIGKLFISVFEDSIEDLKIPTATDCVLLLQGTLYPDVIESCQTSGNGRCSALIKSHHNVGGLPTNMKFKLLEPLRMLYKDEVRLLGMELGLPYASVYRHPFPGPGLAIRIIGEVTSERVKTLREADHIFIEELNRSGEYFKISQAFAVLLPETRTVGVMGDCRTYESLCCLRAVETTDFMTADWYKIPHELLSIISSRIINEVTGINRVAYDISSKPPSTIEWE